MKVSDILRVKGNTLFTMAPLEPLSRAVEIMAEKDLGSLVVMDHGDLAGMLKTVVDSQNFENKMLKAYIRDWPTEPGPSTPAPKA